ncbi:MAG: type I-U CRISPR-associated protein Cas7 [spirochete symbiont of Stewartia floridana]|nr:MAG: type I-U CRISPR-associated protein Cas7 [spirochete symbiont of Stewartia floridana]
MTIDLSQLGNEDRLLFEIELKPLQGDRFQPTGFPSLGAATYKSGNGDCLLVESCQSMANRLEMVCWDESKNGPVGVLAGISHVTVMRNNEFFTDSLLEAHRLNSPYMLEGTDRSFFNRIKEDCGGLDKGPIDRKKFTETLLKYDVGALIHGAFLAKKELAGGRLRLSRALSAFIEAEGVQVAASGGVKNDHVNPSGNANKGFGNVPFHRDEFTANRIVCYANLDLAQIRGYSLGGAVERLLILFSLYKLRKLFSGGLRLRTACDLKVAVDSISADKPSDFLLPSLEALEADLPEAIRSCQERMTCVSVRYDDKLEKGSKDSGAA